MSVALATGVGSEDRNVGEFVVSVDANVLGQVISCMARATSLTCGGEELCGRVHNASIIARRDASCAWSVVAKTGSRTIPLVSLIGDFVVFNNVALTDLQEEVMKALGQKDIHIVYFLRSIEVDTLAKKMRELSEHASTISKIVSGREKVFCLAFGPGMIILLPDKVVKIELVFWFRDYHSYDELNTVIITVYKRPFDIYLIPHRKGGYRAIINREKNRISVYKYRVMDRPRDVKAFINNVLAGFRSECMQVKECDPKLLKAVAIGLSLQLIGRRCL